jgi:hypothetical protein
MRTPPTLLLSLLLSIAVVLSQVLVPLNSPGSRSGSRAQLYLPSVDFRIRYCKFSSSPV